MTMVQWKTGRLRLVRSETSTLPFVGLTCVGEGPRCGTGVQLDLLLCAATQPLCLLARGVLTREVVCNSSAARLAATREGDLWVALDRLMMSATAGCRAAIMGRVSAQLAQ